MFKHRQIESTSTWLNDKISGIREIKGTNIELKDVLKEVVIKLDLPSLLSDIIKEDDNKMIDLLCDLLLYILKNAYNIENIVLTRDQLSKTNGLSKNVVNTFIGNYVKELKDKYFNNSTSVQNVVDAFASIELFKSDKNYAIRSLFDLINSTAKYDTYNVVYNDLILQVTSIKPILRLLRDEQFSKEMFKSQTQFMTIFLNGIVREGQIMDTGSIILKNSKMDKFENIYFHGIINYFSQPLIWIFENIDIVMTKKNEELYNKILDVLNNDTMMLDDMSNMITKMVMETYELTYTFSEITQKMYFLPCPPTLNSDPMRTFTYKEFIDNVQSIETTTKMNFKNLLVKEIINTSNTIMIPMLIKANVQTSSIVKNDSEKYVIVGEKLFPILSKSILLFFALQLLNFTDSLGNVVINSILQAMNQLTPPLDTSIDENQEVEVGDNPEKKVSCDTLYNEIKSSSEIFVLGSALKVIDLLFCNVKQYLIADPQNTLKAYLLNKLKK